MTLSKVAERHLFRIFLSAGFGGRKTIPIMSGPLKGWRLPKSTALANLSMIFGRYESHVIRELFSLSKSMKVAYDIGAHIGFMTLALAHYVGRNGKVFAFEPQPDNLLLLERMILKNDFLQVVKIVPVALGNIAGKQTMYFGKSSSMNFLESATEGQDIRDYPSITVTTSTLDAFVFEEENPAPDILKIDVEGAETMVIEGAMQTLKKFSPKFSHNLRGIRCRLIS